MWKAIEQYPHYLINEAGEIFSLYYKKILRSCVSSTGYARVTLVENGKNHFVAVHRLVANAFVDNPNNLPCVNHKDENKLNNKASNLEWCTYQYNNTYHQRHMKAGAQLRKAVLQFDSDGKLKAIYDSAKAAGDATGIRKEWIARAARGERKTCKGFVWKWAEQTEGLRIR